LPDVKAEFVKYTLLKLYTDTVPQEYYSVEDLKTLTIDRQEDDAKANSEFQKERFNDVQLPLYVVVEPSEDDFKIVARYPLSVITDKDDFVRFLRSNAGNN
jgi:hypothetical protein